MTEGTKAKPNGKDAPQAAAAPAAPAGPTAGERHPATPDSLRLEEAAGNRWRHIPAAGVTLADMYPPKYWYAVAQLLRPFDTVAVVMRDESAWHEFLVRSTSVKGVQMVLLRSVELPLRDGQTGARALLDERMSALHDDWGDGGHVSPGIAPATGEAAAPTAAPADPAADQTTQSAPAPPAESVSKSSDATTDDDLPVHSFNFGDLDHLEDDDFLAVHEWGRVFERHEIFKPVAQSLVHYVIGDLQREADQPEPARAHNYRIPDSLGFGPRDQPNLTRVLNRLSLAGATEREVWAILRNYQDAISHANKKPRGGKIQRPDWGKPGN